jgi:C_GCAxxG_C_C family probable redox protein
MQKGKAQMNQNVDFQKLREDAVHIFHNGFACSESVIYAIQQDLDPEIPDELIAASSGFPWGMGGAGCSCGALAGGVMLIGHYFGRKEPKGSEYANCQKLTREYHDAFASCAGHACCGAIISGMEKNSDERKNKCTGIVEYSVTKTAQIILREKGLLTEEKNQELQSWLDEKAAACRKQEQA